MTKVFYPGCKYMKRYPEASMKLRKAVMERGWADKLGGCCRKTKQTLNPEDQVLVVCNNCWAMIEESSKAENIVSVWELIDQDPTFPLPDYGGKKMAVQDCGRAHGRKEEQDAIRSLLKKMNIEVIELPDARDKSIYCGSVALSELAEEEAKWAPQRYAVDAKARGMFHPHSEEEIDQLLVEHAATIPTDEVVCYCTGCDIGLEKSGKMPVSMLELVFGEY